jgi:chitinase
MRQVFVLILIVAITTTAMAQTKEIIGYYPSWKWKSGANVLIPGRIPFKKLTIIDYAFFYPLADGKIVGRDSVGDDLILKGERDREKGGYRSGTALVELAHRNGVKVMLSVGGWDDSNNFPEVAASETTRAEFAHSCAEQLRTYGFDGIDIDWEFPCLADHKGTANDKYNYTKLLQLTKDSLETFGRQTGKHYLLTIALPAQEAGTKNFEVEKVSQLLDMLNVMTYDFNGDWDSLSGHNSPLYAPRTTDTLRNVDAAFRLFTGMYHVPASKINLGVPFYAHTYRECTALYASHKGADTVHFSHAGCFYYDIVACRDKFSRRWDDRAKAPYLVSSSWNTLISYDDEESVGYKAQYVVDHHACGLIIWEITGDYLSDGTTPLLDVICSKFRAALPK